MHPFDWFLLASVAALLLGLIWMVREAFSPDDLDRAILEECDARGETRLGERRPA